MATNPTRMWIKMELKTPRYDISMLPALTLPGLGAPSHQPRGRRWLCNKHEVGPDHLFAWIPCGPLPIRKRRDRRTALCVSRVLQTDANVFLTSAGASPSFPAQSETGSMEPWPSCKELTLREHLRATAFCSFRAILSKNIFPLAWRSSPEKSIWTYLQLFTIGKVNLAVLLQPSGCSKLEEFNGN